VTYRILLFVLVVFWTVAPASAAESHKKIIISSRGTGLSILPYMIGQRLGFYQEEALDAQVVVTRGTVAIQTLIAGSVGYSNAMPIPAIIRGMPLKILLVQSDKPSHYIVSSPKITGLKELSGKRIAISDFSGNSYLILRDVLQKVGISVDQVQLRPIGEGSLRMMALFTGVVDATILSPEEVRQAEAKGMHVLAYTGDYISAIVTTLVTTDARIKTVPDEVMKMVKATLKGQLFMYENFSETQKFLMEDLATTDADLVKDILAGLSKRASKTAQRGRATTDDMVSNIDRVKQQLQLTGAMPKSAEVSINQVYDFSFAQHAYDELARESWDAKRYHYRKKN
jgi:NitT/TauT family transport system substrate-binding protein